jgi:antitoxin component YwqK of YwqJK toxin-antitoxin module
MNDIRRATFFRNEGQIEEIRYYSGDKEIAVEFYDKTGELLRQAGEIPDGLVREYHRIGTVNRIFTFKNNRAHGKSTGYYPTGETEEESTFRHGKLHGSSMVYRRDGMIWVEAEHKDGKLHGIFKSYHDNGNIEARAEYQEGRLHGYCAQYDRHGILIEEATFNHGRRQGDHRTYDETGQLSRLERYSDRQLIEVEEFDENGRVISTTHSSKMMR